MKLLAPLATFLKAANAAMMHHSKWRCACRTHLWSQICYSRGEYGEAT